MQKFTVPYLQAVQSELGTALVATTVSQLLNSADAGVARHNTV